MNTKALALIFLAGTLRAAGPDAATGELMQRASAAYRDQRYFDALRDMSAVLEADPSNSTAKNYIWVITKKIHAREREETLSPADMKRAMALASDDINRRQRRTREIVDKLKDVHGASAKVRSPQDVLSRLAGLDRFLGADAGADLDDAQAKAYFDEILDNLATALKKGLFGSAKDQLRAEGYLAYFQQDLPRAVTLWRSALEKDPNDARVKEDLTALESLLANQARQEKIDDVSKQAWIHAENGDFGEAARAWEVVLALDPENPTARQQLAVSRVATEKSRQSRQLKEMTRQGVALYNDGDPFGAAQKWLEVLQMDPSFEEARAWLQHASKRLKAQALPPAPARAAAPGVPRPPSGSGRDAAAAQALYRDGVVSYAQGRVQDAIAFWRRSLERDPGLKGAREALKQAEAEISFQ